MGIESPLGRRPMKRSIHRSPYLWTIVAAATVVLVAWMGRGSYQPVLPGEPAPGFTLASLDGGEVSLSDYRGHVVLLNIWATWCPPCIREMLALQSLYDKFGTQGLEIVAVSADQGNPDAVRKFAEDLKLNFPIVLVLALSTTQA